VRGGTHFSLNEVCNDVNLGLAHSVLTFSALFGTSLRVGRLLHQAAWLDPSHVARRKSFLRQLSIRRKHQQVGVVPFLHRH